MESDGEIEYLEEDAEIVQQCVQLSQEAKPKPTKPAPAKIVRDHLQRKPQVHKPSLIRKRKIKTEQHDTDSEDDAPALKKQANFRTYPRATSKEALSYNAKQSYLARKKLSIRIPDYGDPLCLPVRAVKLHESDVKRLNNWNKVCLEHFKTSDVSLKPERGETKSSMRTAIFKNIINKQSGNTETTIWSKTSVENTNGDKKSEIFQCVLPRYKEKNSQFFLNNYLLGNRKMKYTRTVDEVLINKEDHKDGQALVVYKPKESLTAVYGLINKRPEGEELKTKSSEESTMYLKELTCSKICAPCYQTSWRGVKNTNKKSSMVCPICAGTFVSIYNLLSHFKTHSASDVRQNRKIISSILSQAVGYHYKCRICRMKFNSIRNLRIHVRSHQTSEYFKCEVGNHMVNCD